MRGARLLVASLLAAAALAAGCSSNGPEPGPSVSVPGPDERVTLFGTSVYRGDSSFEQALARQDAAYGGIQVARLFNTGDPPPWSDSPPDVADRPVVVSFKLPPAEVIAGTHDAALRQWFASVPRDRDVWWVYFHEPENDIEDGHFTAEEFRAAFRHVSDLAREVDDPALHATVIFQCRTVSPGTSRRLADFDPGADSYDVLGFDCYNRVEDGYPLPADWLAGIVAAAQERDRPWALGEMGSELVPGDDGTARARWLEEVAAYAAAAQAPFVSYFDSAVTGVDYRLTDEPSRQAWARIVSGAS